MFGLDLKDTIFILLSLISTVLSVSAYLRKPGEDAQAALQKHISTDHAQVRERVLTLEERVKHMPTSDELTELEGTVKAVAGQLTALSTAISTMQASQTRVENYLLNANR